MARETISAVGPIITRRLNLATQRGGGMENCAPVPWLTRSDLLKRPNKFFQVFLFVRTSVAQPASKATNRKAMWRQPNECVAFLRISRDAADGITQKARTPHSPQAFDEAVRYTSRTRYNVLTKVFHREIFPLHLRWSPNAHYLPQM